MIRRFGVLFTLLLCLPLTVLAGPEAVVSFNELHYHPAPGQTGGEWIELRNQHAVDVDLSGWRLDGGVDFDFPPATLIKGGKYLVVAADPAAFQAATGIVAIGPFRNLLADGGERVSLKNKNGRVMDEIDYQDRYPWPVAADGSGATLAKFNEGGATSDPANWRASLGRGGTPNDYNFTAPPGTGTVAPSQAGVRRYFPFDGSVQDASGNNVHGALLNGVTFSNQTPAPLGGGQSLECDGIDDYVQVLDAVQPLAYTIAAWVRPETIRAQSIILRTNASGPAGFFSHQLRMDAGGHFEHYTFDGVARTVTGTSVLQAGQWTHVTIVAGNSGFARLYVNGVEEGVAPPIGTLSTAGNRWLIGSNSGGLQFFDGQIDDLAVWHTPFDAPAAQALYSRTIKPTDPAPPNVAFQKEVIDGNGSYSVDFPAQRVTDGSDTDFFATSYWLGRDTIVPQYFTVDLGAPRAIKQLLVRNTHNTQYNDRGTLNFRIFAASTVDAARQLISPVEILSRTLGRVDGQAPILAQAYSEQNGVTPTTARYLKFEALTAVNNNTGLNELEVYTAFSGTPGGGGPQPRPPPVPLVFNEIAAADAAPFWIELHNYGAAVAIGGYVIASESGAQFTIPAQTMPAGGFVAFDAAQLGFIPATGERLFLYTSGKAAVLDGVIVKENHQARRLAAQGATVPAEFLETSNVSEQTRGAINNVVLPTAIVINEIMYHHRPRYRDGSTPFAVDNEQWVELHNRSGDAVDVSGWRLSEAVSFTFPPGSSLAGGGFAIVAGDKAAFDAAHPGVSAVGQFTNNLSNRGERIVLADALGNAVDEVFYRENKPWPEFTDGGGSSLELRDPHADNSVPEAWAASDETARAGWQNYTFTMTAVTPRFTPNIFAFHELRLGLLDTGEVLIDDVSVVEDPAGTNRELMQNGAFDAGTTAWRLLGNHELSNVVSDGGNNVLKIVGLGATNYHPNGLETSLKFGGSLVPVVSGRSYKISFRAKWLRGSPQLHCELYYNKIARTVILAQPPTSGTPGAPNSMLVSNLGPTFKEVRHAPVIPNASQPIVISAIAHDPQGLGSVTLKYTVNGGVAAGVAMALGADGRWSGTIPGQLASAVVQFWLEGSDGAPVAALGTWPRSGAGSRALIQVQDSRARSGRQNLRITMARADSNAMYVGIDMMSQRQRGCTIVHNETEVFYESEIRLRGSMFTRNNPANGAFNLYFPSDHRFRGVTDRASFRFSGRNEIVIKHLINAAGGIPENFNDVAWMIGPVAPTGPVGNAPARLEITEFDDDYFDDGAPDGSRGTAFKMEGIREYQQTVDGNPESRKKPWAPIGWVFAFDIANQNDNGTNPELYRHGLRLTSNRAQDDNSRIVAMALAFSQPAGPTLDAQVQAAIDVDEWMRTLALESLCGIGDAYGFPGGNPHNLNFYQPPGPAAKVLAVPWDWNFVFSNATNTSLPPSSHNLAKVVARPVFARVFWGHVRDLCQTVYTGAAMAPWFTHYSSHTGEGYGSYASYIDARRAFALTRLPTPVAFNITTNGGNPITVNTATTTITGDGWIDVREIRFNASPEGTPITWLDGDTWQVTVPVAPGTNTVTLTAFNHQGAQVGLDSIEVTGTGAVVPASAANLVISELMYAPAPDPGAEFIEVMNIGAEEIDLTGCAFTAGMEYQFADGARLTPGARMVVSQAQFLNATKLSNEGERITLSGPGGTVIKDFVYDDQPPWPVAINGPSLVLIAPRTNPDPNDPFNWRPSSTAGGNPRTTDSAPAPVDPLGDDNRNGWTNLLEYAVTMPGTATGLDAAGRLTFSFLRNLAADEAVYTVEISNDLTAWFSGPAAVERVSQGNPVGATALETWRSVAPVTGNARQFIRLRVQLRP